MQDRTLTRAEREAIERARDSMHILPLAMIPLATPGLRKANLVKNSNMETAVELFYDEATGSGQVDPARLEDVFPANKTELDLDRMKIGSLSALHSFDVYSLRLGLKRLGIEVTDPHYLDLSDNTKDHLQSYMNQFTAPLLRQVYGHNNESVKGIDELIKAWKKPDHDEALKNLKTMSEQLRIQLQEIPQFLEEYSDLFMSVAYFRQTMDRVSNDVKNFSQWCADIYDNPYLQEDQSLISSCKAIEQTLKSVVENAAAQLEDLNEKFNEFWAHINRDSFEQIRSLVTANHETMGGVLCGLGVKMDHWHKHFHSGNDNSLPHKRADFIMAEIVPGLGSLKRLQDTAPSLRG